MNDIRLIAMDMDGTLLGRERGVIPADNLAALQEAHRRGIRLCLASGRAADDVGFYAAHAGLPMHLIALNGAMLFHEPLGEPLQNVPLAEEDARAVFRLTMDAGLLCVAFCGHDVVVSAANGYTGPVKTSWGTFMDCPGGRTRTIVDRAAMAGRMDRVNKLLIASLDEPERLQPLRATLAQRFPHLEITSSKAVNIEVNAPGVTKGAALQQLARSLNIPMDQVMALGDNDNDVTMLRAAGYGVAMGNASPAALDAADYVSLPCLEGGVAAAIRALALGEAVPGLRATQKRP